MGGFCQASRIMYTGAILSERRKELHYMFLKTESAGQFRVAVFSVTLLLASLPAPNVESAPASPQRKRRWPYLPLPMPEASKYSPLDRIDASPASGVGAIPIAVRPRAAAVAKNSTMNLRRVQEVIQRIRQF